MKKILVIENADNLDFMYLLLNKDGTNALYDSEEEAREKVLFMNPRQPVQFIRVRV